MSPVVDIRVEPVRMDPDDVRAVILLEPEWSKLIKQLSLHHGGLGIRWSWDELRDPDNKFRDHLKMTIDSVSPVRDVDGLKDIGLLLSAARDAVDHIRSVTGATPGSDSEAISVELGAMVAMFSEGYVIPHGHKETTPFGWVFRCWASDAVSLAAFFLSEVDEEIGMPMDLRLPCSRLVANTPRLGGVGPDCMGNSGRPKLEAIVEERHGRVTMKVVRGGQVFWTGGSEPTSGFINHSYVELERFL